jgi:hypothetical protein
VTLSAQYGLAFCSFRRELAALRAPDWVLSALDYLDSTATQTDFTPSGRLAKKTRHAVLDSLSRATAAARHGPPLTLIHDWHKYNEAVVGSRNARIIKSCLGLGCGRLTQTELAKREGITRQRVSQILHHYEMIAREWKPPLVTLRIAEVAAQRCGRVVTALEWNNALPSWLRSERAEDLNAASILLDYGWIDGLKPTSRVGIWLRTVDQSGEEVEDFKHDFERVQRLLRKQLAQSGAVEVSRLSKQFDDDGVGFAHAIIGDPAGIEELGGWLLPTKPRTSMLIDRAKRVLAVMPEISINRLRQQISRAVKSCPPPHILAEILKRDLGLYPDERGRVSGMHLNLDRDSLLSPGEIAALRVLRVSTVLSSRRFQKAMVAEGFSASLASILAGSSVVLRRPRLGCVTALGCETSEADLRCLMQKAQRRGRTSLGYRNLPYGGLEIRYRIDPDLLATTTLALPPGRLSEGTWSLLDPRGAIEVHSTYFTGWREPLRQRLADSPQIVSVSFYPESRTISLRVVG